MSDKLQQSSSILIVDDNATNLGVLYDYLSQSGFSVLVAQNGTVGLRLAEENEPDIILLDILMDDMDGYEVCQKLKSMPSTREIPVIFISALSETHDKIKGFETGGVDYITKPFRREEVLARVTAHLTIRFQQQELRKEIHERSIAEAKIRESEDKFRQLAENINLVFWLRTREELLYVSPAYEKIWGRSLESLHKKPDSYLSAVHPEDIAKVMMTLQSEEYVNDGKYSMEYRIQKPDEEIRWIWAKSFPIAENGKVVRTAEISEDITPLKTAEEEIQKSTKNKELIYSVIAHDLKSPLSGFLDLTQMMAESSKDMSTDQVEEVSAEMFYMAKGIYSLLENLLDWSKIQTGRISYKPATLHLREMVMMIFELMKKSAEKKTLSLINEIPDTLYLYADANMCNTVIRNLISNAIKFSFRDGMITVGTEESDEIVKIFISDTGKGILPEDIPKLFNSDEHFTTAGTEYEKGTGLGLTLCDEFVRTMNGSIQVESEVNKGTTFIISLPAAKKENE